MLAEAITSTPLPGPRSYSVAWCHGAAGIALARLRAYELTQLPVLKHEAEVALETTFVHTEAVLRSGAGSYSLCHGLLGNAETLETGYRILGSSSAEWRDSPWMWHRRGSSGLGARDRRGLAGHTRGRRRASCLVWRGRECSTSGCTSRP
jgi:hypothetical protein